MPVITSYCSSHSITAPAGTMFEALPLQPAFPLACIWVKPCITVRINITSDMGVGLGERYRRPALKR